MSVWQEQQGQGRDLSAAELCREHPELAPELERRIRALRQLGHLAGLAAATVPPAAPSTENATLPPDPAATAPPDSYATRYDSTPTVSRGSAGGNGVRIPGYEVIATLGRGGSPAVTSITTSGSV